MLGSRLARRIVWPVLLLFVALFAVLAIVAVGIAEKRVEEEINATADRVAITLDSLPLPRARVPSQTEPPIVARQRTLLAAVARVVGAEIVADGLGSIPELDQQLGLGDNYYRSPTRIGGVRYRVLKRKPARGPGTYWVFIKERRIMQRRSDVLHPILWTGALGLLVAVLIGLLVARTIARPVSVLADRVQRFAEGDYEPGATGAIGPGEIGDLQIAFERMAGAIRESEGKLRESERFAALGRLAGGIAHELRNPLTAIRMAVETATSVDDEARGIAVAEIERLDRTLREMLDYVRPRKPERVDIPLDELFTDIVRLLEPQCRHLRVELEAEHPGPRLVRADRDRLKQALLNLVINAAQAQPHGGRVVLRATDAGLEVSDEGPGIPEDMRESILQPFVTTKAAGIGLGLAVVQQVADEHDAELTFDTGPEGTTFRLNLPIVAAAT